jgi:ferrochelatase
VVAELCRPGLDWVLSYQSRVGPQTWIGPETEDVIKTAGADGKTLVVVPISFVSEHSETLAELDMDALDLAEKSGASGFIRVPTVQCDPYFIGGLADLVDFATDCPVPEDGWLAIGDACRRACLAGAAKCPLEER